MLDQFNKSDTEVNRLVEILPEFDYNLKKCLDSEGNNKEVLNILKSIVLSKTKNDMKIHCKKLIKKLEEVGMTIYPNSKNDIPLLWSNGRPTNVFTDKLYNSEAKHYQDEDSPIFNVLWNIMPVIFYPEKYTENLLKKEYEELDDFNNAEKKFISVKEDFEREKSKFKSKKKKSDIDIENFKNKEISFKNQKAEFKIKKRKIIKEKGIFWINKNRKLYEFRKKNILENLRNETNDTCHYKMAEEGRNKFNNIDHIPYDKFLSELWVEEIYPENISKVRIEFGQNRPDSANNKYNVFVPTDSVMSVSELPILFDLIAKHNINMDLKCEPDKKIYLDNIGVSEEEAISMNYKKIEHRYGEDKNNENSGCLVLKKINRNDTKQDLNYIPVKLKHLIIKAERRRLKKINQRLKKAKDKNLKVINNIELENSFLSQSKQEEMIEKARKKQFERVSKNINDDNMYDDNYQKKIREKIIKHQNKMIGKMENKNQIMLRGLKEKVSSENKGYTNELS